MNIKFRGNLLLGMGGARRGIIQNGKIVNTIVPAEASGNKVRPK